MDERTFIESVSAQIRKDLAEGRAKLELVEAIHGSQLWATLTVKSCAICGHVRCICHAEPAERVTYTNHSGDPDWQMP